MSSGCARIKLVEITVMAINETKQVHDPAAGTEKPWQFLLPAGGSNPSSTHPSPGPEHEGARPFYEISGISFSGNGPASAKSKSRPTAVKSWAEAQQTAGRRFLRAKRSPASVCPWSWDGRPVILQSRATDEAGNVQPNAGGIHCRRRGPPRGNAQNVAAFTMEHCKRRSRGWGDRCQGRGEPCLCMRSLAVGDCACAWPEHG